MAQMNKLAEALRERGISQRSLAARTGIPKSAIQRYISGTTAKVPADRLAVMAGAMGIRMEELIRTS